MQYAWMAYNVNGIEPGLDNVSLHTASHREIRLLHLSPGEKDDELQAHLETVKLDQDPLYEALPTAGARVLRVKSSAYMDARHPSALPTISSVRSSDSGTDAMSGSCGLMQFVSTKMM